MSPEGALFHVFSGNKSNFQLCLLFFLNPQKLTSLRDAGRTSIQKHS